MNHDHTAHDGAHDHSHTAQPHGRAWLRVAVWLSFCILALWVLAGGKSDLYIAANVRWTLWGAIIVAGTLATIDGSAAWRRGDRPVMPELWGAGPLRWQTFSTGLLFVPFAVGMALPPAVLGAGSIGAHDGVVTLVPPPNDAPSQTAQATPQPINLLQLTDRVRAGTLTQGTTVELVGFIYRQTGLPAGEVLLARYITPHCVAEAQPIALVLAPHGGKLPPDNTWVRVTGTLTAGTTHTQSAAVLVPQAISTITPPLDPYLVY